LANKFSVEAVFTAVDNFSGPVSRMGDAMSKLNAKGSGGGGQKISATFSNAGAAMGRMGERARAATTNIAMVGAAGFLAARKIVTAGADLEDALLQGSSKFGAGIRRNTPAFNELKEASLALGRDTKFGAVEAANALTELAKTGFKKDSAIRVLPVLSDLAISSNEGLAESAMMATTALGNFDMLMDKDANLFGPEKLAANMERVADVMAYAANATQADMGQIFETMTEAGPIAVQAGLSFEKFAAIAGSLSQAGIVGSQAGTTIKNVLVRLKAPTSEGKKELARLKISEKQFRKIEDPLEQIRFVAAKIMKLPVDEKLQALDEYFGKIGLAGASYLAAKGEKSAAQLEKDILTNAPGANRRQADIIGEGSSTKIGMLGNAFERINSAVFSKIQKPFEEATDAVIKFTDANEHAIAKGFEDGVTWLKDNLPTVGRYLKYGATAIVAMQAAGALHSIVMFGQDVYMLGKAAIFMVGPLWKGVTALTTFVGVAQAGSGMGLFLSIAGGFTAIAVAAGAAAAAIGAVMLAYSANEALKADTEGMGILDILGTSFNNAAYGGGPTDFAQIVDEHQNKLARQRAAQRETAISAGANAMFQNPYSLGMTDPTAILGLLSNLDNIKLDEIKIPEDRISVAPVNLQPLINALSAQQPQVVSSAEQHAAAKQEYSVDSHSSSEVFVRAEPGTSARTVSKSNHTRVNNHRTGAN
jgi:TP901 family phage tail tape measure protein